MVNNFNVKIGGRELIIETGKMAKQADGAVVVQYGGTVVLVTAVMSKEPKEDADFLPLTVEYQEKTYAAGKIPGGFFKREGRPSEKEILTARLIDRPIRPLFPEGFINEVQIMAMVLSSDGENDPDILAMMGASAALTISDIPFLGPIGIVKIGRFNDKFILNPTYDEINKGSLELVMAGTKSGVIMIESSSRTLSEELILEAIKFGQDALGSLIELQENLKVACGKPKQEVALKKVDDALFKMVKETFLAKIRQIIKTPSKEKRIEMMDMLTKELVETIITQDSKLTESDIRAALNLLEKQEVRRLILNEKVRADGRTYDQIRPISCEVGILPRTHGSALFTRGETQGLSVTTLGTSADEQLIDALEGESFKSFMLHYNFPPFSVGEVSPVKGPGRREIGHGALAERALAAVMPPKEEFPYTIRVVSDILESNGSTSMATVCAGSMSLMDAGVPIKAPVSGIAMGLVKDGNQIAILTDIAGLEDHFGDMDFKVAGTKDGITALQVDVKIKSGLDINIIIQTLQDAKRARLFVLEKMLATISEPKPISVYAPRIVTMKIEQDKIRDVIGPAGKTIKKIIDQTGVTIDIEDDGTVAVASTDAAATQKALDIIKGIVEEVEVGKIYLGKIKRLVPFGAFCEITGGKEGLIHISELDDKFVNRVEDVVKVGDEVLVKVIEIDEQGRINLSRKKALPKTQEQQ